MLSIALPEVNVKFRTRYDLDIVEFLVDSGNPLVLAHMKRGNAFALEKEWPKTAPGDRVNLDRWLNGQGDMLAIITGHVYDVFDFDVQNGGSLAEFLAYYRETHENCVVQAVCATPSGGYHLYVNTLKRRKMPIALGIDYQSKNGIAFIPPSKKYSKTAGEIRPYRWSEFSYGGGDSGAEIYEALSNWSGHRPRLSGQNGNGVEAAAGTLYSGITLGHIDEYRATGLSEIENHDDTLRDIAWKLCLAGFEMNHAYTIWQEVVDRTDEKDGKRSYEERDFERHWRGAATKLGETTSRFNIVTRASTIHNRSS